MTGDQATIFNAALNVVGVAGLAWVFYLTTRRMQHFRHSLEGGMYLVSQQEDFMALELACINPLRQALGLLPIWVVPATPAYSRAPAAITRRAYLLYAEIKKALKPCVMPATKKTALIKQAGDVPGNVVRVMWKLERLRRVRRLANSDAGIQQEVIGLEQQLQTAADDAVNLLASLPLSLIRLELAQRDAGLDVIVTGLRETNARMKDLAEAYAEVRLATG